MFSIAIDFVGEKLRTQVASKVQTLEDKYFIILTFYVEINQKFVLIISELSTPGNELVLKIKCQYFMHVDAMFGKSQEICEGWQEWK